MILLDRRRRRVTMYRDLIFKIPVPDHLFEVVWTTYQDHVYNQIVEDIDHK